MLGVGIAADHGGFDLKEQLAQALRRGEYEVLDFGAYERLPGEPLTWLTYWRVRAPAAAPLKLFLHLLDAEGTYVVGEDRLDVWYDNWAAGDILVQVHELTPPADLAPGRYQVELGVYDPETMQRLPVVRDGTMIADRILLGPLDRK